VYRTDWQGTRQLFSTPRTNSIRYSDDFSQAAWVKAGFGTGTAPVVTPNAGVAPDGVSRACRVVFDSGSGETDADRSQLSQAQTTIPGETFSQGVWMKSFDGVSFYEVQLSFDNAYPTIAKVTPEWQHFQHSAPTVDNSRGYCLDTRGNQGSGRADVLVWGAMQRQGTVLGSHISTSATPVTVTDFTLDQDGVAQFPDPSIPPTPIEYFLTGRIRVTLPVSSDNGLGLLEIAKAFRPTLPARLMLELHLSILLENIGASGGLALANAMTGVMPFYAIGTLQR
jgi:hypothetical protein